MVWNEEETIVKCRNRIHRTMVELYCDYECTKDFLFSRSGKALVQQYGGNPYRIVEAGFDRFCSAMRKAAKGIRKKTLQLLWDSARSSVLHQMSPEYIEVLEDDLRTLYSDWERHSSRRDELENRMIGTLRRIRDDDPAIPEPAKGFISERLLARLIAETGPLSEFSCAAKLLNYAGMNLCERQSGTYKGQTRISKKGRAGLRRILGRIILPLVRQGGLFAEYYRSKREGNGETEGMCGGKAMTAVARSFLNKFFGCYRSGGAFERQRLFTCLGEYRKSKPAA
jgi:hypothetical protein